MVEGGDGVKSWPYMCILTHSKRQIIIASLVHFAVG